MKPNVLFIIDSFEQGGSERQALQLLRQLHLSAEVRVHLATLGHPLLVDPRYGDSRPILRGELHASAANPEDVALGRTPLHAAALRVPHPSRREFLQVEAPIPADLATCLELLRAARREQAISSGRAPASSRPP